MTDYPDSDYEDTPEELNEERITNLVAENDRLRAEVERYFKAGQEAEAEVERLRRLPDQISAEAHAVPIGDTYIGGGLHGTPRFDVMMWAVRRIRAALRGGR